MTRTRCTVSPALWRQNAFAASHIEPQRGIIIGLPCRSITANIILGLIFGSRFMASTQGGEGISKFSGKK